MQTTKEEDEGDQWCLPICVKGLNRVYNCNGGKSLDGISAIDKGLNRGLDGVACLGKRLDDRPCERREGKPYCSYLFPFCQGQ